ncbi:ABC transporter permease [Flexithrix dorotheae]|uniref:ABC transporter permease n=1 Tax=Flexithrix dorotheae TaxID=70993 RepID=UPI00036289CD|nr:ABC transporter permease [Flexithrix dorotheae]
MWSNYLKIAIRNLIKNRFFSLLNLAGLGLAMAASLLLFQYISFEMSYDKFHDRSANIYRTNIEFYKNGNKESESSLVSPIVGSLLIENFPEVEAMTRMVVLGPDGILSHQENATSIRNIYLGDSCFFNLFSFELKQGDRATMLSDPFKILISEAEARQLFGETDPIGKTVEINAKNLDGGAEFTVSGVFKDLPENTHLKPGVLISYPTLFQFVGHQFDRDWLWNQTYTYIRLNPKSDHKKLEQDFDKVVNKMKEAEWGDKSYFWRYNLQPIESIHLNKASGHEAEIGGSAYNIYFLSLLCVFILVIAYLNYINLSVVKSFNRSKEIGIRKVSGAFRYQIVTQFLLEAILLNIIAIVLAIGIIYLVRTVFSENFSVDIHQFNFQNSDRWLLYLGFLILLILGSAYYPAFIISKFNPVKVLKGIGTPKGRSMGLKKMLTVFQFALSILFLIGTFVISSQLNYLQNRSLGFEMDQVLVIKPPKVYSYKHENDIEAFKQKALQIAGIQSASGSNAIPGEEIFWFDNNISLKDSDASGAFKMLSVDKDYFQHFNIELLKGRQFEKPTRDKWIINKSGAKLLGFENPEDIVGEFLAQGEIIGLVEDFHQESPKSAIQPTLFSCGYVLNYYSVKIQGGKINETLSQLEAGYKELFPGSPFEYFFLDEFFNRQYQLEKQFAGLFTIFSMLVIFISCLGLTGLTAYSASLKTKEIGIRKVLGAKVSSILLMLSEEYFKLIVLAFIIALPVANYILTEWLKNFAYKIDITWWLFALPGIIVLTIALISVLGQSMKAALTNPTKSLRNE